MRSQNLSTKVFRKKVAKNRYKRCMHLTILRSYIIVDNIESITSIDAKTEARPNLEKNPINKKLHYIKINIFTFTQN